MINNSFQILISSKFILLSVLNNRHLNNRAWEYRTWFDIVILPKIIFKLSKTTRKKKISFDKRLNRTIFHERRKRKARVFETRRELQLLATTFPFLSRDTSGYSKISMLEGKEGRRSDEASKREAALRGLKNGKYVWRRHASRGFIPRVHTSSRRRRA